MNSFFDQAFSYLLKNEGGFVNDPQDSGGPTNFGITQRVYENYLNRMVTTLEVKEMQVDTAKKVYFEYYWHPLSCHRLTNLAIATCLFDTGVLYGTGVSANLAQRAANILGGTLKIDGDLGDTSVSTLNILKQEDFLNTFRSLLLARIDQVCSTHPKDERFRKGWINRADHLLTLNVTVPENTKLA